ncbi:Hsp70 family protein, partial [Mycolicibacterium vanbaalenii]|uniref:Hsp70 family protein n=1 Tax=Mycolicibacterium vanbaalenii TaxID=110539 RepID=UPI0021F2CE6C
MPHLTVVPDAVAALTAVHAERGLPGRGVVVLCDFGATGTTITLVDAGDGMTVIGHTVRSDDFSGDLVDQLVLRHVVTGLDLDPSGTSAVASLADLRVLCRGAKERLSADTATALTSAHTAVRLTRAELDDVIAHPLDLFVAALIDTLQRNGVPQAQLAAVATVGGGAAIPLVAQRLSETLRIPVVAPADPQAAAAAGAELLALRVAEVEARTTMVPAPTVAAAAVPLAWSQLPRIPRWSNSPRTTPITRAPRCTSTAQTMRSPIRPRGRGTGGRGWCSPARRLGGDRPHGVRDDLAGRRGRHHPDGFA